MSRAKPPHVGPSNASIRRAERDAEKTAIRASVRLDAYAVISRAVEEGIAYGYQRAHKHLDRGGVASADTIKAEIETAVMNALSEVIKFDDGGSDEA